MKKQTKVICLQTVVRIIAAFCFKIRQNKNSFHYVIAVEITIVYIFIVTSPREIHQLVFTLISSVKSRVEYKKSVLNSFWKESVFKSAFLRKQALWIPALGILFWLSCSDCPVLTVQFWLSCSDCPVLTVLFWLSCSDCPVLAVLFWQSCSDCPVLAVLFLLSFLVVFLL